MPDAAEAPFPDGEEGIVVSIVRVDLRGARLVLPELPDLGEKAECP